MTAPTVVAEPFRGGLFSVQVLRVRGDDGHEFEREVVRHPGAVAIVPVLEGGGAPPRLVMIRNRRAAVDERLWELPAGKLEPGEAPEDAAARELEEETGHRAGRLCGLGTFFTSPGFADEVMHVFVADRLERVAQRLEPGESIDVHELALPEVLAMARDGTIRDAKTLAALFRWRLELEGPEGRR